MNRTLLHIAPFVRSVGGVETLIAQHVLSDGESGFAAHSVALFDGPPGRDTQGTRLGFNWKSTPATMRRQFRQVCAAYPGSTVVHHGAWGVPLLAAGDDSVRRILFLHGGTRRYARILPQLLPWADGVACVAESAAREVRRIWEGDPARVATPPLPIFPPSPPRSEGPRRDEWVVGQIGRLVRSEKAAHRLVDFVREARRLGLRFRVEVVGDGPLRGWLKRRLAADPQVEFLGWLKGEEYWQRLRTWDCVVSFSDREGGPIAFLEAMSTGVIPIYPAIGGSLGDDYVPQVDARCYYPAGDVAAAARALQAMQAQTAEQVMAMRQRAVAAVQPHVNGCYAAVFAGLVKYINDLPRISRPGDGRRTFRLTDRLPLGLITRLLPGTIGL